MWCARRARLFRPPQQRLNDAPAKIDGSGRTHVTSLPVLLRSHAHDGLVAVDVHSPPHPENVHHGVIHQISGVRVACCSCCPLANESVVRMATVLRQPILCHEGSPCPLKLGQPDSRVRRHRPRFPTLEDTIVELIDIFHTQVENFVRLSP